MYVKGGAQTKFRVFGNVSGTEQITEKDNSYGYEFTLTTARGSVDYDLSNDSHYIDKEGVSSGDTELFNGEVYSYAYSIKVGGEAHVATSCTFSFGNCGDLRPTTWHKTSATASVQLEHERAAAVDVKLIKVDDCPDGVCEPNDPPGVQAPSPEDPIIYYELICPTKDCTVEWKLGNLDLKSELGIKVESGETKNDPDLYGIRVPASQLPPGPSWTLSVEGIHRSGEQSLDTATFKNAYCGLISNAEASRKVFIAREFCKTTISIGSPIPALTGNISTETDLGPNPLEVSVRLQVPLFVNKWSLPGAVYDLRVASRGENGDLGLGFCTPGRELSCLGGRIQGAGVTFRPAWTSSLGSNTVPLTRLGNICGGPSRHPAAGANVSIYGRSGEFKATGYVPKGILYDSTLELPLKCSE